MAEAQVSPSSASVVAQVIDDGTASVRPFSVIALCVMFNMVDGFDITAMAIVAGSVASELGLTDDRLGLIFSTALAGMMVGAMMLAPISDIIGRRKMIIASLALVGISVVFTANANTLHEFVALFRIGRQHPNGEFILRNCTGWETNGRD